MSLVCLSDLMHWLHLYPNSDYSTFTHFFSKFLEEFCQVMCGHTYLEAPRGVTKFAKDTNPLGPSKGSIQSMLGHF